MKAQFINELDQAFINAKKRHRAAIMPFLTMGYPEENLSLRLLQTLSDNGADIIEVGIPYSDPLADGPVIQASSQAALERGMTPEKTFEILTGYADSECTASLVIMTYYNILLQMGLEHFVEKCRSVGVRGVVVPDLPLEESKTLKVLLDNAHIHLIHFVAPNLSDERIKKIAQSARGFIYLISVTGVTGQRQNVPDNVASLCARIRQYTDTPIALGFGIGHAEQVSQAAKNVDGVIVGSALIKQISEPESAIDNAAVFLREISAYE